MTPSERLLLSGNEAIAHAARDAGVWVGTGYPGTPSSEILETLSEIGGRAQWAPNEKVALEVGIGVAYGKRRTLVTMKHVGVNVAADPFFAVAHTGVDGGLVIVSADDPGMASSQNEQDNRNYAAFAGVPMLEPSDSQEAYDLTARAFELSEQWNTPVMLRVSTRICHSRTVVRPCEFEQPDVEPSFDRDISRRVMIPAFARPAHKRLREKLHEIKEWNEANGPNRVIDGDSSLGIITSGISYVHAREAAPDARFLKLSFTYPLPIEQIREFAESVDRCVVIEEGDPYLVDTLRAEGIDVEGKPEEFRFGELNVGRVRSILSGEKDKQESGARPTPPRLCPGCPHRESFQVLDELDCIVTGDIGCYTLGALAPYESMDTCLCMGGSVGVGLGLRHSLPEDEARRVVSVIGDSTFVHSGLTGMAEMVYNPPPTGHIIMVLDNRTTAMTGMQEHPGTGRKLDGTPTEELSIEDVARSMGVTDVHVIDPHKDTDGLRETLKEAMQNDEPTLIVARRPCLLALKKQKKREKEAVASCE